MGILGLILGLLLPWALGVAALLVLRSKAQPLGAPGEIAWYTGAGYLIGILLLTLWMRLLSVAGIAFGINTIGLPLLLAVAALGWVLWRRNPGLGNATLSTRHETSTLQPRPYRYLWWGIIAWLALRFLLLGNEVALRPLYPWEAWIEWATKARVYFEFRRIVPFVSADSWLTAHATAWFDASPRSPITLPLLQTWACIALGRWDDVLMNWPWWQFALALTLILYGGLRRLGTGPLAAMLGTYLAASLPLLNVHVALAGYADLPLAAYLLTASLAFLRWADARDRSDALLAAICLGACPLIKATGVVYLFVALPALVLYVLPQRAPKILATVFGAALFALAVLAQTHPVIAGHPLHLDFVAPWQHLGDSYFLFDNWHLLWYGFIVLLVLAWREIIVPPLAMLSAIVANALFLIALLFCFPDLRLWLIDPPSPERASLHWAPVIVVYLVLVFRAFAEHWIARHPQPIVPMVATARAPAAPEAVTTNAVPAMDDAIPPASAATASTNS